MIGATSSSVLMARSQACAAVRQAARQSRRLASVSQGIARSSSSSSAPSSSSTSSWKMPIQPGVEPAYDEAIKYISEQQASLAQQMTDIQKELANTSEGSIEQIAAQAKLNSYAIASRVNDPEVRWRFDNDPNVPLSEPVFAHLREKAWRQGKLPQTVERVQLMRVVPDAVASFVPLVDVQVFFGQGTGIGDHGGEGGNVQVGCFVAADKSLQQPAISATPFHKDERLYTIALVDLDAPYEQADRLGSFALWLAHNVPLSLTKSIAEVKPEHVALPYIPPHPQKGTAYHRYALVLLEQTEGSRIDVEAGAAEAPITTTEEVRQHFAVEALAAKHNLRAVGLHFWRAIWQDTSADAISAVHRDTLQRRESQFVR